MNGDSTVGDYMIPMSARRTIQDIKEITGNHSDEDVYGMLKECSMDLDETVQRLLYLGTFHEVKKKRNRRKESSGLSGSSNHGGASGMPRQGERSGRGNNSSYKVSYEAAVGRSLNSRKEGGVNHNTTNNVTSDAAKSSSVAVVIPNNTSNGDFNHGRVSQSTVPGATDLPKSTTGPTTLAPTPDVYLSVSDQSVIGEISATLPTESKPDTSQEFIVPAQLSCHTLTGADVSEFSLPLHGDSLAAESYPNQDLNSPQGATDPLEVITSETVNNTTIEADAQSAPSEEVTTKIHKKPELIFPNSLQVPESSKNGLIFGSLDSSFGVGKTDANCLHSKSSKDDDEDIAETIPCQNESLTAQQEEYIDHPQHVADDLMSSESVEKHDQLKLEMAMPPEASLHSVTQSGPAFSFDFVQPSMGSQLAQVEGSEPRAQDRPQLSTVLGVNSDSPSSAPTPYTGVPQTSIAVSPPPVPVFPQPYPLNFLPYGQYISPFYTSSALHQFLGHGGFPQQPSTGSLYLTPAVSVPGLKYPLPPYKVGTNTGSVAQVGVPSGFGYGPSPAMTTSGSSGIDNLAMPQAPSKDNSSYVNGQQGEGSTVWMPGAGQQGSYYNIPPQGQPVALPPFPASGVFAGLYHPAPAGARPLLQQSQALNGPTEKMGPLLGAYQQQQQQASVNWNSNY